jgi:carbamoyl-phosphate synthase large subunit
VQYGGQTPLKLAEKLWQSGAPVIGTSPDAIDLAEDRERFKQLLEKIGLQQPPNQTCTTEAAAITAAQQIGYPLVVRPSYVLGGRAMEIVYSDEELTTYMSTAVSVSNDAPVLLDRFLDDAIEVDVDAICDGVHSGDSGCSLPPYSLSEEIQETLRAQMTQLALELGVCGLVNAQFAIKDNQVYVIEVNPRASRTVPFVSKAPGMPLAAIACITRGR